MKKIVKLVILTLFILFNKNVIYGEDNLPGYSDWDLNETNEEGEISATQYGRKVPIEWSEYSYDYPSSKDMRTKDGGVKHYAYENQYKIWWDVDEKVLFTWDFGYSARVTFFYADVDTYYNIGYSNYEAPPLKLYCDGKEIASIGKHDHLENWSPSINTSCRYLELKMMSNYGDNRNRTSIVGTWATTGSTMYSYVTKWSEGRDWRFNNSYQRVYGENPQIPVTRTVYSRPIVYSINYDLDGGEFAGEPIYSYTVLHEVNLPKASKLGYEFLGWYDDNDKKIDYIPKGSYGNLNLHAKYKRKPPVLYIGYVTFKQSEEGLDIPKVLELVKASAMDELDKDISDNIKISYFEYDDQRVVENPEVLDISKKGYVYIEFYVVNSGDIKASIKRKYYILGDGEVIDPYSDNLKIYSRYISEDYLNTLAADSIWQNVDYLDELRKIFEMERK